MYSYNLNFTVFCSPYTDFKTFNGMSPVHKMLHCIYSQYSILSSFKGTVCFFSAGFICSSMNLLILWFFSFTFLDARDYWRMVQNTRPNIDQRTPTVVVFVILEE